MSMLNQSMDNDSLTFSNTTVGGTNISSSGTAGANYTTTNTGWVGMPGTSCWHYWQDFYYPQVIRKSYPVYIQERAKDKGKQAFEIIKVLKDKKLIRMDKVGDFIDLMDSLINIL